MPTVEEQEIRPFTAPIQADSLARLLEISTRLSSTLHLETLLDLVMEVATELTNTEAASILLVDQKTGQLHFAASTGSQMPQDIIVPLDNSIAGWVVRNGRSLVLADVQADDRFYANVDEDLDFHTRSMLAVPLVTAKGIIGCLEVINKADNSAYSPQDMAILEALASQSAVAILNAHLFQQSDLLAEIMHELKTPLMAITTASELLSRPDFPAAKQGEVLQMIQRESERLSRMTKEFVDFARLESGRMHLERQPVNIDEVIKDVVRLSQAQAEERGIALTAVCPPDLPTPADSPCLVGDQDRLKQVLLNLVSNGIKYNQENGRLTITAARTDNQLTLTVSDTGQGISPEDLPHLFERFYRIPGSEDHAEGSGLGLAIAEKIVSEHHGRIAVDSEVGSGTTFTIILPLTRPD
ncbi:MAG: GAF domain-containing sensor histidine kinase [Ardenticatenaceae bacterium]|nr:GAF domain-containing sensor histidine kinase [Ardenticatenaceae bacterium]MCB8986340.1 GAF domain-containing sensor histidine kinase [Ardenticatenaceae bacterium]